MRLQSAFSSQVNRPDSQSANPHFLHGPAHDLTTMNTIPPLFALRGMYRHNPVHHKYDQAMPVHAVSSLKISDGGVLVRDMIPVRFTNEAGQPEGAMYDRVSGELFRNQGTEAFIIGPDNR